MIETIQHPNSNKTVVVAKLLIGYLMVSKKVSDFESFVEENKNFDDGFKAYVLNWQETHNLTADGIIGPATWTAIAASLPTCSTSKNTKSGPTLAIQILLDTNIVCDAIYGAKTKNAVAVFQDSYNLKIDGICGPKTWNAIIVGKDISTEKPSTTTTTTATTASTSNKITFKKPVDYKQYDSKWANKIYSNHNSSSQTMRSSGCGPAAVADIIATLKDPSVNPWTVAQLSMKWGDRSYNNGTDWTLFKPHCQEHYKFSKCVQSGNWSALKACLDAGGYVVCSMAPGYWTSGGHFICAWKYDDTKVYCNDPASSSRKSQLISQFKKERKQYFCFYPDAKIETEPVSEDTSLKQDGGVIKRGEKICDISKYQPTINYDKFIADTSLIIARAGYRGTGGSVKMDEKIELHAAELLKRGVRFGVYFFSIATTEEKAREEARMFYKYAKDYNPLFWAMDAENDGITKKAIVAFADELRNLGAKKVGCYVANHLHQKYDYSSIRDKFDFTWIPRYGSTRPSYFCDLWQYTSTGSVGGISGNVDLNKITGDGKTLEWFTEG